MSTCWRDTLPLYLWATWIAIVSAVFNLTSNIDSIVVAGTSPTLKWAGAVGPVDVYLNYFTADKPPELLVAATVMKGEATLGVMTNSLIGGPYKYRVYDGTTSVYSNQFMVVSAIESTTPTSTKVVAMSTMTSTKSSISTIAGSLSTTSVQTTASFLSSQVSSTTLLSSIIISTAPTQLPPTVMVANQPSPSSPLPTNISPQSSESGLALSTLSIGAKTGIAIGAVCGICGLSGLLFLIVIRRRARVEDSRENSISEIQGWNGGGTKAVPFVMQGDAEVRGGLVFGTSEVGGGGDRPRWEIERDRGR